MNTLLRGVVGSSRQEFRTKDLVVNVVEDLWTTFLFKSPGVRSSLILVVRDKIVLKDHPNTCKF